MSTSARLVSPLERILFLRGIDPLRRLPRAGLVEFAARLTERAYPRGTVVAPGGQPIESVFIVAEGQLAVDVDGVLDLNGPGSGVNFARLIGGHPTGRRVVARVDTVVLALAAPDLLSIIEANPGMLENNLRQFAGRILSLRGDLPLASQADHDPVMGVRPSGPIDLVQRLIALEEVGSVWRTANLDAVVTLAQGMSEVRQPAGTTLWSIGEPAVAGVQVHYGKVRCTGVDGRQVDVGAGFGLGFMDAIGGRPRAYDAVTLTDFVALEWAVDKFFAIIEAHPATGMKLLSGLAHLHMELWEADLHRRNALTPEESPEQTA